MQARRTGRPVRGVSCTLPGRCTTPGQCRAGLVVHCVSDGGGRVRALRTKGRVRAGA